MQLVVPLEVLLALEAAPVVLQDRAHHAAELPLLALAFQRNFFNFEIGADDVTSFA